MRRKAAFALAVLPEGIRALTALMADKDSFIPQTAVFPFDDITETLADRTPGEIQSVKEALPALIRARQDKDRIVREVADEVLDQIAEGPSEILRDELRRLDVVVPSDCG